MVKEEKYYISLIVFICSFIAYAMLTGDFREQPRPEVNTPLPQIITEEPDSEPQEAPEWLTKMERAGRFIKDGIPGEYELPSAEVIEAGILIREDRKLKRKISVSQRIVSSVHKKERVGNSHPLKVCRALASSD